MPKRKETLPWGGYLNMRLDQSQKQAFEIWYREMGDDVWELFLQALSQGMKYSLVYDAETDTYTSSLTNSPKAPCGVSSLYVLSAYAPDWRIATALVLYKHFQVLGGTWENYRPFKSVQDRLG